MPHPLDNRRVAALHLPAAGHMTTDTYSDIGRIVERIRGEYREMPGLRLTISQAGRLWHLEARRCQAILNALVDAGFLRRTHDGAFIRA